MLSKSFMADIEHDDGILRRDERDKLPPLLSLISSLFTSAARRTKMACKEEKLWNRNKSVFWFILLESLNLLLSQSNDIHDEECFDNCRKSRVKLRKVSPTGHCSNSNSARDVSCVLLRTAYCFARYITGYGIYCFCGTESGGMAHCATMLVLAHRHPRCLSFQFKKGTASKRIAHALVYPSYLSILKHNRTGVGI